MNKKIKTLLTTLVVLSLMTMSVSAGNIGTAITSTVKTLSNIVYQTTIKITSPVDGTRFGRTNVNIIYGVTNSAANVGYSLNGAYMGNTAGSPFAVTGSDNGATDGGQLNTVKVNVTDPTNGSAQDTITFKVDVTAPGQVTSVGHTNGTSYINWTWTPPVNTDFNNTIVNVTQGTTVKVPNTKIPKGTNYFNATGLNSNTDYTMSIRTEDDAPAP
jgi:hypothetical protein